MSERPPWTPARIGDYLFNRLAARDPHIRRLRRPARAGSPAFNLAYVRTGPRTHTPAVVIPGGPGLASVLPYKMLRRQGSADGLDLIMVEHRGVGLSRFDTAGADLGQAAMWVKEVADDIAAVLDRERIPKAFLAGSSYGTYLASSFAARHPERVAGMLLDSALQSAADIEIERQAIRALFWEADTYAAHLARHLTASGEDQRILLDVVRSAYELSGTQLVEKVLGRRVRGARNPAWTLLETYGTRSASRTGIPAYYEFARAGTIGFRELEYGPRPDGGPLDPALTYSQLAPDFPSFAGEPYDLTAAVPRFNWPLVLLSGTRDLRTPPAIARRVAKLAPQASFVAIENGHSALDTHALAFGKALKLLVAGAAARLPGLGPALDTLPHRGDGASFTRLVETAAGIR